MIIVQNKNIQNSVYFPKNIYTNNDTGTYYLNLIERGSNQSYVFSALEDSHLVTYGFYTFLLDFSSVPEGEYEYTVSYGLKDGQIPREDYTVEYGSYVNDSGLVSHSIYTDIWKYELPADYSDYEWVIDARIRRLDGATKLVYYFNGSGEVVGSEIPINPNTSYNDIALHIPENVKSVWFNTSAPITIADTFTMTNKSLKEKVILSKGIIRLNELKDSNEYYNEKTEYVVYDTKNQY